MSYYKQDIDDDTKINILKHLSASHRKYTDLKLEARNFQLEDIDLEKAKEIGEKNLSAFLRNTSSKSTETEVSSPILQKSEGVKSYSIFRARPESIAQKPTMFNRAFNGGPMDHSSLDVRAIDSMIMRKQYLEAPIEYDPKERFQKASFSESDQRKVDNIHQQKVLQIQRPSSEYINALNSREILPNPFGPHLTAEQLSQLKGSDSSIARSTDQHTLGKTAHFGTNQFGNYGFDTQYRANSQRMHTDRSGWLNEKWMTRDNIMKGNETLRSLEQPPMQPLVNNEDVQKVIMPYGQHPIEKTSTPPMTSNFERDSLLRPMISNLQRLDSKPIVVSKFIDDLGNSLEKINVTPKNVAIKTRTKLQPLGMEVVTSQERPKQMFQLQSISQTKQLGQQKNVEPDVISPTTAQPLPQQGQIILHNQYMDAQRKTSKILDNVMIMPNNVPSIGQMMKTEPIVVNRKLMNPDENRELTHQQITKSTPIVSRPSILAKYSSFDENSEPQIFRRDNVKDTIQTKPQVIHNNMTTGMEDPATREITQTPFVHPRQKQDLPNNGVQTGKNAVSHQVYDFEKTIPKFLPETSEKPQLQLMKPNLEGTKYVIHFDDKNNDSAVKAVQSKRSHDVFKTAFEQRDYESTRESSLSTDPSRMKHFKKDVSHTQRSQTMI